MTSFLDFGFVNGFIPAAFFVAGFLVMFKFQWQAFFYFLAVVYACDTVSQFVFLTFLVAVQIVVSVLYRSAADVGGRG